MRLLLNISITILLAFSLYSCSKSTITSPYQDDALRYFPLEDGNYWLYAFTFISVDASVDIYDTISVELRMDYIEFDEDIQQHILQRRIREDSNAVWQEYDVITIKIDSLTLQWNENNLRYVKLTDPVYQSKSWDGNIYNTLTSQNYYYSEVNTTFETGDTIYSPCLYVLKNEIENVIQSINAREVFAKDVGPVYEYEGNFSLQGGEINIGSSKELTLIKFGKQ